MTDGKRSCGSKIGCKRGLRGSADGGIVPVDPAGICAVDRFYRAERRGDAPQALPRGGGAGKIRLSCDGGSRGARSLAGSQTARDGAVRADRRSALPRSSDGGIERNGSAKRGTGLESERRDLASAATEQAADAGGGQKMPDFDKKLTNFTDRVSQTLLQSEGKCGIITKMSSEDGQNSFSDIRSGFPRRMTNRPIERGVYVKGYVGKNQKSRA